MIEHDQLAHAIAALVAQDPRVCHNTAEHIMDAADGFVRALVSDSLAMDAVERFTTPTADSDNH